MAHDARLEFDAESHTYRYEGVVIPSVTQILGAVFPDLYGAVPPAILARKAALGVAVHTAVELHLVGALEGYDLHPDTVPYIESFKRWALVNKVEPLELECRFYSRLGFAGTFDFLGTVNGEPLLLDWKTTAEPKRTHSIQTAGYSIGYSPRGQFRRGALYLKASGAPAELIRHANDGDIADWMAVLRVFNLKEKMQ